MKVKIQVKKLGKSHSKIAPVFYDYRKTWIRYEGFWRKLCALIWRNMGRGAGIRRWRPYCQRKSMEEQAGAGKITFGLSLQDKVPDYRRAAENACQCFEDGIAVVFLDGKKLEGLEEKISLRENSELVFVRMTMLAGRMW